MLTRHVAGRVYNYDYCIGKTAVGGNGFYFAVDFALGSGESLYVISKGAEFMPGQGITKCTLHHKVLWEDRGLPFGGGESPWPASIAVDISEKIYIADDHVNRIFIYNKDGEFLGSWGATGSGDGQLLGPSGLACDNENYVYVVDGRNSRVQKFTQEGKFLARWGGPGTGEGQLNMPWGITVDKEGDVYVADWSNDRIQKFAPDGKYLATFGRPGTGDGELRRPTDIAVDSEGDVYVTDWGNKRLNIYTPDGAFLTAFIGDADVLSPWSQAHVNANPDFTKARRRTDLTQEQWFMRPVAVNVDDEGRIMVLENQRGRIQVYVKERNFVDAQFNL